MSAADTQGYKRPNSFGGVKHHRRTNERLQRLPINCIALMHINRPVFAPSFATGWPHKVASDAIAAYGPSDALLATDVR